MLNQQAKFKTAIIRKFIAKIYLSNGTNTNIKRW
jgi:hypothetical protein